MDAGNRDEEEHDPKRDEGEALQHKPEAETGRQQDETGDAEPRTGFAAPPAETVGNDPGQGRDHNAGEQVYRLMYAPTSALVQPISRTRNMGIHATMLE